jgi:Actinobacteria/chloroflexi VLRF1 release factor
MSAERVITVEPERLRGWLERFAGRHGAVTVEPGADEVAYTAADGAVARVLVPFPPLAVDASAADGGLVAHALAARRVGVVLVRLGGHAAGVFEGADLVAAKVGQRPVHGRSAAGGWSQHRFARRREGQARVALTAAADAAVATVLPAAGDLDAVVLGGDRRAVEAVLADPRLAPLRGLVVERRLDVPDPRRKVLAETPKQFRAVRIRLTEPDQPTA